MKTKLVCLLLASALLMGAAAPTQPSAALPAPCGCCCASAPSGDLAIVIDYLTRSKLNNQVAAAQYAAQYFPEAHWRAVGRADACGDALDAIRILTAPKPAAVQSGR